MFYRIEECLTAVVDRLKFLEKGNETPTYLVPVYDQITKKHSLDEEGNPEYTEESIEGYLDVVTSHIYNLKNALDEHQEYNIGISVQFTNQDSNYLGDMFADIHWTYNNGYPIQAPQEYWSPVTYTIIGFNKIAFPTADKLLTNDFNPTVFKIMDDVKLLLSGYPPTNFSSQLIHTGAFGMIPISSENVPFGMVAFGTTFTHMVNTRDEFTYLATTVDPTIVRQKIDLMEDLP